MPTPDQIDAANEGKLIHVSGTSNATAPLADPEFDISTKGLRMARIAEMYQWEEEKHEETTQVHRRIGNDHHHLQLQQDLVGPHHQLAKLSAGATTTKTRRRNTAASMSTRPMPRLALSSSMSAC